MTQPFTPTPDMLAILAEVEANPRSKFLKLPIHLGNPGTYAETLTGSETFLTSAEKKLVRSYRDELETWLFYRAMRLMAEAPGADTQLINTEGLLVRSKRAVHPSRSIGELNRKWASYGIGKRPCTDCPISCLQAALRLLGEATSIGLLALAEIQASQYSRAHIHLDLVLNGSAGSTIRAKAANNLGLLQWQVGNYQAAAKAYGWAAELDPTYTTASMFALISAGFAMDRKLVHHHAKCLEDLGMEPDSLEVASIIEFCKAGAHLASRQIGERNLRAVSLSIQPSEIAQTLLSPYLPAQ